MWKVRLWTVKDKRLEVSQRKFSFYVEIICPFLPCYTGILCTHYFYESTDFPPQGRGLCAEGKPTPEYMPAINWKQTVHMSEQLDWKYQCTRVYYVDRRGPVHGRSRGVYIQENKIPQNTARTIDLVVTVSQIPYIYI